MKKILFLSQIILLIIVSCATQENKFPMGAWKWVSAKAYSGDSLVFDFPGQYTGSAVKIWAENNVNDIGRFKRDTTVINVYNGATYKLEGNRYYETVQYHFMHEAEGHTLKCLLELKNDTLFLTGEVDDNGKINKKDYAVYKLVRVK
jgi:hypothetical protein